MRKVIFLSLLMGMIFYTSYSQFDKDFRIGVGAGASFGVNEAKTRPLDLLLKASARLPFSKLFSGDFSVSYTNNSGKAYNQGEYKTRIIPLEAKLLFTPFTSEYVMPYAFAGVGLSNYDVTTVPWNATPGAKLKGWAFQVPLGAGIEFRLSKAVSLDLHLSGNHHFSDNLYPQHDNINDGYWAGALSLFFSFGEGDNDIDKDGLTNDYEKQIGTDPKNPDTDGDGLKDGEEVNKYHTDPLKFDTDGDGLSDGDEVLKYGTDPLKSDTDGDGLKDGEEVMNYKTNPLKADTDGDGLSDGDEVLKYKTNPLKFDTDGDGLSDGDEVLKYKTNPLDADTDGDGLSDGEEVLKYHTNPLKTDTDGGSVDDGIEVKRGTNPLDPKDDVAPKKETLKTEIGKSMVLEGIEFETGKSTILPESETILNKALNTFTEFPDIVVEIQGHTDNAGKRPKNMKLSLDRANAVKAWLVERGVNTNRITTSGFGPDKPLVPNTSKENMKKNRRIEFVRIK